MQSYTIAGDGTVHMYIDGMNKAVRSDAPEYESLMSALRDEDWDKVREVVNPLKEFTDRDFKVEHGVVVLEDDDGVEFQVPTRLGNEMIRYADMGLPTTRLMRFAKNLDKNPSQSSVSQLFGWLKETNLTLTDDGCFIAYKAVKQDWTDKWTGKNLNVLGVPMKMKRNLVDEDATNPCSHGWHVATFEYAKYWGGNECRVLAVKVHPKDVVAVPNAEHQKMRVCEYLPLEEVEVSFDRPTYEETPPIPTGVQTKLGEGGSSSARLTGNESHDDYCEDCSLHYEDCVCEDICVDCGEEYEYCVCYLVR